MRFDARVTKTLAACVAVMFVIVDASTVGFDPESGSTATKDLRVTLKGAGGSSVLYTLNGATPELGADGQRGADTKVYQEGIHLPIGSWIIKAAVVSGGTLGEISEAKYDVLASEDGTQQPLTFGGVFGIALLLVMGLFGFVVFAGVCTAGYNALFKSAPAIRGPGASDPRIPRSSSSTDMELGAVSSFGFRNNPTNGDDNAGTSRLLSAKSSSSGDLTPIRAGKKD